MASLEIHKAKSRTKDGKWFTFEIEEIRIIRGQIYFLPKSTKYQAYKLVAENCIIIK